MTTWSKLLKAIRCQFSFAFSFSFPSKVLMDGSKLRKGQAGIKSLSFILTGSFFLPFFVLAGSWLLTWFMPRLCRPQNLRSDIKKICSQTTTERFFSDQHFYFGKLFSLKLPINSLVLLTCNNLTPKTHSRKLVILVTSTS